MSINYAYLAGVLDSDGSFSIAKRHVNRPLKNYTAMIQLSWKKSDISIDFMNQLVHQYGGSWAACKSTNKLRSFPATADYLKYSSTGVATEKIIRDVLPFLILKKKQALNLLKLRELTASYVGHRPNEISAEMEILYYFNKSLNNKNGWKNEENRIHRS
jgi:hypothetical protein